MGLSVPITVLTSAGPALVSGGAGRIVYTSVIETSGAASASFALFDGVPATARGLVDYSVNASGSARDQWPEHGIPFETDLWIGSTVGAATVRIHVVPEDRWHEWGHEHWRPLAELLINTGGM